LSLSGLISSWGGPRAERWTTWLVLAGATALPLQNTATVDVGFTVRLSHVLFGAALLVGLPFALRGVLLLPPWLRWSAVGLVATYAIVTATSDLATIAGTSRGGSVRAVVYLSDLALGVGLMALVAGVWRGLKTLQPLLLAITAGAGMAALYAVYQWPALRFGLPLSDILTTRDSNGLTTEAAQGPGLFGWERVRGTFLEPQFLGAFMSAAAPVAVLAAAQARGRTRALALLSAATSVMALVLTSSAPAFASLAIGAIIAGTTWAVGAGRPRLAAVAASATALVILATPILVVAPEAFSAVTGRDSATLIATAHFRTQTWNEALDIWAVHPASGYGAGQSSVQLSLLGAQPAGGGLRSAQGLWASALVDVGVIGLGFWLALIAGTLALALRTAYASPSLASAMLVMALTAAVCAALVANDRLDLRVWLLFGVVAAASRVTSRSLPADAP
jgi:O-antigen ligase